MKSSPNRRVSGEDSEEDDTDRPLGFNALSSCRQPLFELPSVSLQQRYNGAEAVVPVDLCGNNLHVDGAVKNLSDGLCGALRGDWLDPIVDYLIELGMRFMCVR